jgi:hypothetical protein
MRFTRTHHQGDEGDAATVAHARGAGLPRAQRILAYLLLILVMGAVAAMSWSGVFQFATTELRWSHWHASLVPISLDIAAMACALMALDSISKGESGTTFRGLAGAFVGLSAYVNWRTALKSGNVAEEVFFPAMSILAYALVHAVMDKVRREVRRQQHGQAARQTVAPLPRLGLLPWLPVIGSPRRALGAVKHAVAERVPEVPAEVAHRDIPATVVLEGLTQADAIRRAIAEVGTNAREVVAWLAANDWPDVAPQRVYDVIRRDQVRAVGTGELPVLREEHSA